MFTPTIVIFFLASIFMNGTIMSDPLELNIMTFNIRYGLANDGENHWNNRKDQVYQVIRQNSPDIIGLQEALRFQIDEILANVPEYAMIGEGRDGGNKGEYTAILYHTKKFDIAESSTFWLSETPNTPSLHWGNAFVRTCTYGRFIEKKLGRSFYIYNAHLDHISQISREKSAELMMKMVFQRSRPVPFILIGDFNVVENNSVIKYLKGEKLGENSAPISLIDSFRAIYPTEKNVGTFHSFTGKAYEEKIDYIFVSPDIKVLGTNIIRTSKNGLYPSDHFPVVAKIELK